MVDLGSQGLEAMTGHSPRRPGVERGQKTGVSLNWVLRTRLGKQVQKWRGIWEIARTEWEEGQEPIEKVPDGRVVLTNT